MEYVYLLKNNANNRVYVGRTYNPELRLRQHLSALRSNRHTNELMQKDFNTYGENVFSIEVVEENENLTRSGIERKWMLKLKSYDKEHGYNYKDPLFRCWNGKPTRIFSELFSCER